MNEVHSMIEDIAPFRGLARASRQLSVDGVEHHEGEAGKDTGPVPCVPEQEEGGNAKHGAIAVTMLGVIPAWAAHRVR